MIVVFVLRHGTASSVVGVDVVTQYDGIRPKDAIVMHTLSQEAVGTCTSEPTA